MSGQDFSFWGRILEIGSGLGVAGGIIFGAVQINQSQQFSSADVETHLYERLLETDRLLVESEGLAGIMMRGDQDPESLAPDERARFAAFNEIFYDTWEFTQDQFELDVLNPEDWREWECWFIQAARRRPPESFEDIYDHYNQSFADRVRSKVEWGVEEPAALEGCEPVARPMR